MRQELKPQTEELQKSEAKHKEMIANISDVIPIMGADGTIKYKSPNIERWFGWQPEDLVGADGWATVYPDDLERIRNEFISLLKQVAFWMGERSCLCMFSIICRAIRSEFVKPL